MAEISQILLPNGNTYDIKDSTARAALDMLDLSGAYAGSAYNGGPATSAESLTADAGDELTPVYINQGYPTETLGKTIPYIVGDGATQGEWLGSLTGLTAYTDGLLILYKPATAGGSTTTLNLNGIGAKTVYINNTTKLTSTHFPAYQPLLLVYSASQNSGCWMALDNYWTNSNTIPQASMETGAGTTAKTALMTYYTPNAKSYLMVTVRYSNTAKAAITLNINGQGPKPIYINGSRASSSNYTLPAGSYLVYYDGTNYYFRTDGKITGTTTGNASVDHAHELSLYEVDPAAYTPNVNLSAGTTYAIDAGGSRIIFTTPSGGSGGESAGDYTQLIAIDVQANPYENAISIPNQAVTANHIPLNSVVPGAGAEVSIDTQEMLVTIFCLTGIPAFRLLLAVPNECSQMEVN